MNPISLPNWLESRSSGVLLHVTSLPGEFGIGNLGRSSREFIDFLHEAGFRFWQICPVGPTGYGDSPYQVFSSSAGNPYLIDWQSIVEVGILNLDELAPLRCHPDDNINYGHLFDHFYSVAQIAYSNFEQNRQSVEAKYGIFSDFIEANKNWLEPYCCYQALKKSSANKPWWEWEDKIRKYSRTILDSFSTAELETYNLHSFFQYLFFSQWKELRAYAHSKDVQILGDLPIYVAPDSADVWERPELFHVDSKVGEFSHVAGVPPDYFNADGQYWGNPLYHWSAHQDEGYDWWIKRLESQLRLFDVVRIDHFRGFHDYWSIPKETSDAKAGEWKDGPGIDFWEVVAKRFPSLPFLAEDLGLITEGVRTLRRSVGLPGMAVLQFAFDGDAENLYLPHNLTPDLVLYTGTHDNDTTCGWYHSCEDEVRGNFRTYFNIPGDFPSWDMLRMAYRTTAQLVIVPMQDLLSLGSDARLNEPGHPFGNWTWRMTPWQLKNISGECAQYLRNQAGISGRLEKKKVASLV